MRRRVRSVAVGLALVAVPLSFSPIRLSAQSIFGGEGEGRVLDQAGYPVRGASVTLSLAEAGSETGLVERTRDDGIFSFSYAPGGLYDVRVEALGYRPVLVLGVGVAPGDHVQVPVVLVAEPPPVSRQDTIHWLASGQGAPTMGRAAGGVELDALPDRTLRRIGEIPVRGRRLPQGRRWARRFLFEPVMLPASS